DGQPEPFSSSAELRDAHGELLRRKEFADPEALRAEVVEYLGRVQATGGLLSDGAERLAAQSLMNYWCNTLIRAGIEPPEVVLAPYDPRRAPELDDHFCPYVGMGELGLGQAGLLFGRERMIEEWVAKLGDDHVL